ncbi:50S ribosomal protein L13 [Candidatus Peregrinibacteria bacterium]|nr:50S ribosomal protein L13 [Candidatus Peregrinibacteria bacterium]
MKTSTPAQAPLWVLIDAQGQSLGRVAAQVAMILRGKHRPTFSPQCLCGDHVIIINAAAISIPPGKFRRKEYVRHTGYPGNLRHTPLRTAFEKKPAWVMEHAVRGMLPANRLRPRLLQRLHVFPGMDHPHAAQKPVPLPIPSRSL